MFLSNQEKGEDRFSQTACLRQLSMTKVCFRNFTGLEKSNCKLITFHSLHRPQNYFILHEATSSAQCAVYVNVKYIDSSNVNKDWTCKDKDKDQAYKDKDLTHKDQDKDKDLNLVLKKGVLKDNDKDKD